MTSHKPPRIRFSEMTFWNKGPDVLQIYRIIHGIDQIDYNMFFKLEEGTISSGHSLKTKKSKSTTDDGSELLESGLLTTETVLLIISYNQPTLMNLKSGWRDSGQRRSPNFSRQDTIVSLYELF